MPAVERAWSVLPGRLDRGNVGSPVRWQQTREERDDAENDRHAGERRCVQSRHLEQYRLQGPAAQEGPHGPEAQTGPEQSEGERHELGTHLSRTGSQGHAQADLAASLGHGVAQHAADAEGGEEDGEAREETGEQDRRTTDGDAVRDASLHGPEIGDRQLGVEAADQISECHPERLGREARAGDDKEVVVAGPVAVGIVDGSGCVFVGEARLLVMDAPGGEPWVVTKAKGGVTAFAWAPDGKTIAHLATEPLSEEEDKKTKAKDDERVIDRDLKMAHLWTVDVDTKKATRLTEGDFTLADARFSPDGREVAVVRRPTPKADDGDLADVLIVPVAGGAMRVLVENAGADTSPRYSPDGKQSAFVSRDGKLSPHANPLLMVVSTTAARLAPSPRTTSRRTASPGRRTADRCSTRPAAVYAGW